MKYEEQHYSQNTSTLNTIWNKKIIYVYANWTTCYADHLSSNINPFGEGVEGGGGG